MFVTEMIQFGTNILDNSYQFTVGIFSMLSNFITEYSVIISSSVIGILSFLFFVIIIQTRFLPGTRKKHFLKNNKLKHKKDSEILNKKQPYWQKISVLSNFYKLYQWANLPFTYEFFLLIAVGLFVAIFFFMIVFTSFFTSIVGAIFITYLYFFIIKVLAKRNYDNISEQLPFVLETLSSSIQSGYSLVQALRFTAKEVNMPFKLFFDDILVQINYNIPLAQVFANTQKTTKNQEFKIVLDGLIMQERMGGDIVKMLRQMASWVRQKNKLQKDIKVFTSQGRLSGIVIMLLWPISAMIFYVLNSTYITILFTSGSGRAFLILSLVLEIIGFAMIWKIIKIKI